MLQYPPFTMHLCKGTVLNGETAKQIMTTMLTAMAEEHAEARARRVPGR